MAFDSLIRGGQVVQASGVGRLDIAIDAGRIASLAPEVSGPAREVIDARGLHVFPGVLDAHVHFNDPGRDSWEGVPSGSSALVAGGGTCFIDMPLNSSPPTLDSKSFDLKLAACSGRAFADFALWGGLTPDNLDQLEALAERGVVGFKAFMSGSGIDDFLRCDDESLYRGMRIAARLGLPVAVHAENDGMTSALSSRARAEGRTSVRDYLDSRPIAAEAEAISRALAFAEDTGCALHVVHTSSARGVRLIRQAVEAGLCDATCETCPHYLLLCAEDVERLGARAKCAPPLRPAAERQLLLEGGGRGARGYDRLRPFPFAPGNEERPRLLQGLGRDQRGSSHASGAADPRASHAPDSRARFRQRGEALPASRQGRDPRRRGRGSGPCGPLRHEAGQRK